MCISFHSSFFTAWQQASCLSATSLCCSLSRSEINLWLLFCQMSRLTQSRWTLWCFCEERHHGCWWQAQMMPLCQCGPSIRPLKLQLSLWSMDCLTWFMMNSVCIRTQLRVHLLAVTLLAQWRFAPFNLFIIIIHSESAFCCYSLAFSVPFVILKCTEFCKKLFRERDKLSVQQSSL